MSASVTIPLKEYEELKNHNARLMVLLVPEPLGYIHTSLGCHSSSCLEPRFMNRKEYRHLIDKASKKAIHVAQQRILELERENSELAKLVPIPQPTRAKKTEKNLERNVTDWGSLPGYSFVLLALFVVWLVIGGLNALTG